jgi:hypothetical protein
MFDQYPFLATGSLFCCNKLIRAEYNQVRVWLVAHVEQSKKNFLQTVSENLPTVSKNLPTVHDICREMYHPETILLLFTFRQFKNFVFK